MARRRTSLNLEIDVSDLSDRLAGITFDRIRRHPEFARKSIHRGLLARDETRSKIQPKLKNGDPRRSIEGVMLGFANKQKPTLFINLNDKNRTVTRVYDKPRKRKRKRSLRTQKIDNYYGRSRAFILRFVNTGTRRIKARNFFYRNARAALVHQSDLWVQDITKMINDTFRR